MANVYAERRRRLLERIDGEAFLVFDLDRTMPAGIDHVSLSYLTGFRGEGALVLSADATLLFTDSRYLEQAEREAPDLTLLHAENDYLDDIAREIRARGIRRLAYADWRTTGYVAGELRRRAGIELVAKHDPVTTLRLSKDEAEIAHIERAIGIAEEALLRLLPKIKAGLWEKEIAFQFGLLLHELGSERTTFDMTVASGPNASLPHYRPSLGDRAIEPGDLLLIDFVAVAGGYVSDITRTFVVGEPTEEQRAIYDWVRRATDAGLEALRAGVPGREVHRAASAVIEASPYREHRFLSPVGHGIGLEVHEEPRMGEAMAGPVAVGSVVTIEPGVYIPGVGGVRIEEIAVVTKTGCRMLTSFPRNELISLPAEPPAPVP